MHVDHSFTVAMPVDQVWQVLSELDRISAHVPGAKITSATPERVDGALKVKLGPLNMNYQGAVTSTDRDAQAQRAVIVAEGTDSRNGTARSTTTVQLTGAGASTDVTLTTELELTGKPAQFGATVMHEVGTRLLAQFAAKLEAAAAAEAVDTTTKTTARPRPRKTAPVPQQPDLSDVVADAPDVADGPDVPDLFGDVGDAPDVAAVPDVVETPDAPAAELPETPDFTSAAAIPATVGSAAMNLDHRSPTPSPVLPAAATGLANLTRPVVVKALAPVALAAVVTAVAVSRRRAR